MPNALIVEDDATISVLIAAICNRLGIQTDVAADGETALVHLRRRRYDALLLDLMLPKVNGFELLREVRSICPELLRRTIIITAAGPSTLRDFDGGGTFTLLHKPFDLGELADALLACTDGDRRRVSDFRVSAVWPRRSAQR